MTLLADRIDPLTLRHRTAVLQVHELPDEWFDGPGDKVITVRQLTGNEIAICQDAQERRNTLLALANAITGGASKSEIERAARDAIGATDEPQASYVFKLETVKRACVPPLSDAQIATIGEYYGNCLERIYQAVRKLTGQGADASKKPSGSGEMAASEPV